MKQIRPMPRAVAHRIMRRYAAGERILVLVGKDGKPSSVWGFDEYLERKALAKKVRPWEQRKKKSKTPDPLGAWDLGAVGSMRREDIYE
ncbi:MAG: hypothetical protein ACRD24_16680 [Terriglobales bacterium]